MKTKYTMTLFAAAIAVLLFNANAQASSTDRQIESSFKESHVSRTYLKDDDIQVESKDGIVTLDGSVSEEANKQLAQETVANMSGVKGVHNRLEFNGETPAEHSDAWLMTKVKTSLLYHRSVSGFATGVDVKDGIVILGGEADSQEQKDLATEYAKDIDGVKEVRNEMTVARTSEKSDRKTMSGREAMSDRKTMSDREAMSGREARSDRKTMGEAIDDASITALAKSTLLYHRSTRGINTKVETNDGVVTLTGKAKNAAEKDLAARRVGDVDGVKRVVNNMTVD